MTDATTDFSGVVESFDETIADMETLKCSVALIIGNFNSIYVNNYDKESFKARQELLIDVALLSDDVESITNDLKELRYVLYNWDTLRKETIVYIKKHEADLYD